MDVGPTIRYFVNDFISKKLDNYLHMHMDIVPVIEEKIKASQQEREEISGILHTTMSPREAATLWTDTTCSPPTIWCTGPTTAKSSTHVTWNGDARKAASCGPPTALTRTENITSTSPILPTSTGTTELSTGVKLAELIKRTELDYEMLAPIDVERPELSKEEREEVNIEIKYEGYIKLQLEQNKVSEQFHSLLKAAPDELHIKSVTVQADLSYQIKDIRERIEQEKDENCKKMGKEYENRLLEAQEYGTTHRFFITFPYSSNKSNQSLKEISYRALYNTVSLTEVEIPKENLVVENI